MKNSILHNRFWLVVGILLLVECAALFAFRSCPRQLPGSECSEVYRHYAHAEGVEAAFVKDFPINDTVAVDVTLLHATDSAGWAYLTGAFKISKEALQYAETHSDFVMSENLVLRGSPETRVAVKGEDCTPNLTLDDVELLAINYRDKEFGIFHTRNAVEVMAVRSYDYEKMITNKR